MRNAFKLIFAAVVVMAAGVTPSQADGHFERAISAAKL